MGNWADLLEDLLVLLAKRIALFEDFLAFGGVCRSWRSVAVDDNFVGLEKIPWLMLSEKDSSSGSGSPDDDERQFFSLRKGGVIRKVMLPEARGRRCFESLGWLVTVSEDGEMNLLHPFTRVQIELPHINTFDDYIEGGMLNNFIFIQKAVLSSAPPQTTDGSGGDYVVMVIHGSCGWLGFWRPGFKTWVNIETHPGAFRDVVYCRERFYAIHTQASIFECNVNGPDPTVARLVGTIPNRFVGFNRTYIVESAGAVLVVLRDGFDLDFLGDYGDDFDENTDFGNLDESRIDYGTREFQVFEVDLSNRNWAEKKSLGDNALFLGDNASLSLEASRHQGIKADCIYYTDDCWEAYKRFKRGGGKDMGIYNLKDGSQRPCYQGSHGSFSSTCPPLWVNSSSF